MNPIYQTFSTFRTPRLLANHPEPPGMEAESRGGVLSGDTSAGAQRLRGGWSLCGGTTITLCWDGSPKPAGTPVWDGRRCEYDKLGFVQGGFGRAEKRRSRSKGIRGIYTQSAHC